MQFYYPMFTAPTLPADIPTGSATLLKNLYELQSRDFRDFGATEQGFSVIKAPYEDVQWLRENNLIDRASTRVGSPGYRLTEKGLNALGVHFPCPDYPVFDAHERRVLLHFAQLKEQGKPKGHVSTEDLEVTEGLAARGYLLRQADFGTGKISITGSRNIGKKWYELSKKGISVMEEIQQQIMDEIKVGDRVRYVGSAARDGIPKEVTDGKVTGIQGPIVIVEHWVKDGNKAKEVSYGYMAKEIAIVRTQPEPQPVTVTETSDSMAALIGEAVITELMKRFEDLKAQVASMQETVRKAEHYKLRADRAVDLAKKLADRVKEQAEAPKASIRCVIDASDKAAMVIANITQSSLPVLDKIQEMKRSGWKVVFEQITATAEGLVHVVRFERDLRPSAPPYYPTALGRAVEAEYPIGSMIKNMGADELINSLNEGIQSDVVRNRHGRRSWRDLPQFPMTWIENNGGATHDQ